MRSNKLSFCIQLSIAGFYFSGLHDIQVGGYQGVWKGISVPAQSSLGPPLIPSPWVCELHFGSALIPSLNCLVGVPISGPPRWTSDLSYRYLASLMGWAHWFTCLYLPDRFWTLIAALSSVLFLVQWPDSSWQEHPDGPWIWFIACHVRGYQSGLWPEVGPAFRKRTTHFGICLGFIAQKRLCFIDPGSEGKSEHFYQPF